MSEKLGFVFGLFLFTVFILPFGVNMWYLNFESDRFLTLTSEVQKLTNQEGGVSRNVLNRTDELKEKGYIVQFIDKNNNEVVGSRDPGESIYIQYQYQFKNIYGKVIELNTSNEVLIQKRRSVLNQ